MATDFDAIIVGSGFGGAVAACRLSEAGYKVLVLERGRRWTKDDYPSVTQQDFQWDDQNPAATNGWFDIRLFGSIGAIAAAGVGGGSLHYANVSINAYRDLFDDGWPPEITFDDLEQTYYPKVSSVLTPTKIPANQFSNRTKLMKEAATKAGYLQYYTELDLAVKFDPGYNYDASQPPRPDDSLPSPNADGIEQGFCVHLGKCVLGCPVEARNTVALNYLPRAEKRGAQIRPLHIVKAIEPIQGGYKVQFDKIENGTLIAGSVTGRIVIVAGGSIGSSQLLLHCRDNFKTLPNLGPMLGKRWSSNGNFLSFAVHPDHDVFPTRGPTISAAIRFLGDHSYNGEKFFIEDGGAPDVLADYRQKMKNPDGKASRFAPALDFLGNQVATPDAPMKHLMFWFAQGRDQPIGTFSLKRQFLGLFGPKLLSLSWDTQGARKVLDAIQEIHRILAAKTGSNFIFQTPDAPMTPHPLGGCPIGTTRENGFVDHRGEIFDHKNLFVADGSIIPKPIGHNPSKTIAALSERISAIIIAEGR